MQQYYLPDYHTIDILLLYCSFTYQATANCVLILHNYWSKLYGVLCRLL
jgi:hypothetical protein